MPAQIRPGLQTITWGDAQAEQFPQVFEHARQAGYQGVEIGYRRMENTSPEFLKEALAQAGLTLVATHMGGNIENPEQARQGQAQVDSIVESVSRLKIPFLHYSGIQYTDDKTLTHAVDYLSNLARQVADIGARLLYHNHAFEFEHGGQVMDALLQDTDASLDFCVDVGWLHKGGIEVIPFLEKNRERIGTIHFKDFASTEPGLDTVPLGEGVVPLEAIGTWIREQMTGELWVLAEQDKPVKDIATEVAANGKFLNQAFPSS